MALTEDRSAYFQDFAVGVTIGTATGLRAIFDRDYIETAETSGEAPILTIQTSEIPSSTTEGTQVSIEGESQTYRVVVVQSDGTGISRVVLEEEDFGT